MTSLTELSQKYNTDKKPENHNYIPMYEFWLKDKSIRKMLEVGFGSGASARMWEEYYPNAEIHIMESLGSEYSDIWGKPDISISRVSVIVGDSTNPEDWKTIAADFDLIIDDGSHNPDDQIATFYNGFAKLKSGGLYFIEDTHCNFEKKFTDRDKLYPWVRNLIVTQQLPGIQTGFDYPGNFYAVRHILQGLSRDILSFHFYKSIIMFEKA